MRPIVTACVLTLLAAACVDKLPLQDRPCPCTGGWKCCRANFMCIYDDQICPGGAPCSEGCEEGQLCFSGTCYVCDRNRYCGINCVDCTNLSNSTACVEGRCGCRTAADCSPTRECRDNQCQTPGKPDGGSGDGGIHDASGSDGSSSDGGDYGLPDAGEDDADAGGGDTGPYCPRPWTNKRCGYSCADCTGQDSNWACTNGRCGCYTDTDCAIGQACLGNSCVGRDGGI